MSLALKEGLAPRSLDVLDVASAYRLQRGLPLLGFFCDVSQGVKRKSWGPLHTLTTSAHVYSFKLKAFVSPLQKLGLHGYPVGERCLDWESSSGNALSNWAGEGMFLPCVGSLLLAYFLNPLAPWWNELPKSGKRQKVE